MPNSGVGRTVSAVDDKASVGEPPREREPWEGGGTGMARISPWASLKRRMKT